jgi:formylglycine-generating enzyme required for sulfatase activity/tRNA A-37 threonylcarbamoyl transferase component Bud32
LVASRYSVLNVIGRGGMGCIYRVQDNVLKEEVALKTLLPQFVRDKMVVERFFNEARIARQLSHPNIVRVHDIGMTNNIIYISMELVKGKSLRTMVDDLAPGQRLPTLTALHVIDDLCAALEYAHRHTVHRDIKPENVMVSSDGTVKLMDFGISKLTDRSRLTGTSIVMGTPFYMSPEQLKNSASVDARADLYSVGVVLYEILTGNVPTGVPKPASQLTREVPPALDPIVAKCVDPDPDKRYQSATELRAALRPVIALLESGSMISAPAESKPRIHVDTAAVRKGVGIALMLLIVGLAGTGIYGIEKTRTQPAPSGEAAAPAPDASGAAPNFDVDFQKLEAQVARARSAVPPEASDNEDMTRVLESARTRWDLARTEADRKNPKALALVFVPPGTARIGDGALGSEVALDGFFIDTREVTNGQYLQFCAQVQGGWRWPSYSLEQAPADLPVVDVTFYDALAYAAWAGKELPSEAQWARAAYGDRSASDRYPWGSEWEAGACNSGIGEDGHEFASPVASFVRDHTWSGCYDMAGNVSEWTRTASKDLPYDARDGRDDPSGFTFGTMISVRGGNLRDTARSTLSARFSQPFEAHDYTLGFRCVKTLPKDTDLPGDTTPTAQPESSGKGN